MKKILLLLISLTIFLTGCDIAKDIATTQEKVSNEVQGIIPFLTFYNDSNNKVLAKLSYWNIKDSTVDFTDKLVYIAVPTETNDFIEPVIWDGDKRIVLHKTSSSEGEFKEKAEVIENYTMNTIYGRNIEAVKNMDSAGNAEYYSLFLNGENGIIEKKAAFLLKTKDDKNNDIVVGEQDVPSYIDYNNKTGEITFIFKYYFETYANIYVAKCNINDTDKINWDEIKLSEEIRTGGIYTPYPNNSVLIGSKYYIQSSLSFAEVDLDKKASKTLDDLSKECRSTVKEGSFEAGFPKDILPVGVYKDILILNVPISTDTNLEYLMCAYRGEEFLGAIHLKSDDTWNIIDSNKKVINEIDVKDKGLYKRFNSHYLYFPWMGNIM